MTAYLVLTAPESFNLIETHLNRAMNDSQKEKTTQKTDATRQPRDKTVVA